MVRGTILVTAQLNRYFIDTTAPPRSCLFSPLSAASARDPCRWVWDSLICFVLNRLSYVGSKSVLRNDPTEKKLFIRKGLFQAGSICGLEISQENN